jgi:hypothetical protein
MSSFRKAVRTARKLRLAVQGPSGSGKTRSALEILSRIAKRVAVIDTEHSSADAYAPIPGVEADPLSGTFDFDNCPMDPPYTPHAYIAKINEAAAEGYDGLIIDSLSHAWMGDGGILSMADKAGKRFDVWKDLTPLQHKLMAAVLSFPGHVIVTMRTQTAYEITKDERTGKNKPEKIGTKPVQKEGTEYEFDIVIDIDPEHVGHVTKSRCSEIENQAHPKPGAALALTIKRWLSAGGEAPVLPPEKSADRLAAEATCTRGVAKAEELAAALGAEWPSWLTLEMDALPPEATQAINAPGDASNAGLKAAIAGMAKIIGTLKTESEKGKAA